MRMLNPLTLISCMILSSNCYTMHYPGYVPLGQVLYPRGVYIDQTWCVAAPCPTPSPIVIDLPGEDGFTCPGNGLFPDPQSGCKAYYNCNEGQVRLLVVMSVKLLPPLIGLEIQLSTKSKI